MPSRGEGGVIFIASENGIMTPPELIDYGMTKSAQLAISRGMAELTKGTNVIQPRGRPRSLRRGSSIESVNSGAGLLERTSRLVETDRGYR
jgi:3-oxoacyl-[acyl-carrier protein] reductase